MKYYVGIDVGSATCVGSYCATAADRGLVCFSFENSTTGIGNLEQWLLSQGVCSESSIICMESCGVYAETLCYTLHSNGWSVHVEPPLKVHRAMPVYGPKNDQIDAENIARYAARFVDELHRWQPRSDIMEQVATLLVVRESHSQISVQLQNQLSSIEGKHCRSILAESLLQQAIARLKNELKCIDSEIQNLISSDEQLSSMHKNIDSVPGVGPTLAAFLLVQTNCFSSGHNAKELSAYLGIAPLQHQSGISINRKPRSRGFGHGPIRRLLYLAAMSAAHHNDHFREYFRRMVANGKNKRLIINNIENKIVSVICAVVKTGTSYDAHYAAAS